MSGERTPAPAPSSTSTSTLTPAPTPTSAPTPAPGPSSALKSAVKIVLLLFALSMIASFFAFHLDRYLTMSSLREHEAWLHDSYRLHPVETMLSYSLGAFLYVVFAMPAATIIMLLAGALFGAWLGGLLCVISVSLGAVVSLLASRFLFRDFVRRRFARQVAVVEREYARNGASYLIAMRLIPVLPYFITNLVFGLTPMPTFRFWITTFFASMPLIFIYANAGAELSKIQSLGDIFTWRLAVTFVALAALPFIGRFVTKRILLLRKPAAPLAPKAGHPPR